MTSCSGVGSMLTVCLTKSGLIWGMVLDILIGDHLDCVHWYVENHLKCEQDHSKPRILDCINRDTELNTKHVFTVFCIATGNWSPSMPSLLSVPDCGCGVTSCLKFLQDSQVTILLNGELKSISHFPLKLFFFSVFKNCRNRKRI